MFKNRDVVCCIEIGTSKVCVLAGAVSDRQVEVVGRGLVSPNGSVVKGEICDYPELLQCLERAVDEADRSSGGALAGCRHVAVLVTGCGISSQAGVGSATIRNEQRVVTEAEIEEANENAQIISLAGEREIINCSGSYYKVDGRRVSEPLRLGAVRLETHVHLVHGIASRLDVFRSAVRDAGFSDADVYPVFSALADDCGILSDEERKQGVLLVNIGAGCTEYIVEYDNGIAASGVVQLGMDNVANDIAVVMNLHIDLCRKMLMDGSFAKARDNHVETLDFRSSSGAVRKIPFASFETIIDLRLREIFELIREQLKQSRTPRSLNAGGVLTGGGADFYRTADIFREVFELNCSKRIPADVGGSITGLDDPRFTSVWGGLKVAAEFMDQQSKVRRPVDALLNALNGTWDNIVKLKKAIRF